MTTTNLTHEVKWNAEDGQWDVIDRDGDAIDFEATRGEAIRNAQQRDNEIEASDLAEELVDTIGCMDADDLATLRALMETLKSRR